MNVFSELEGLSGEQLATAGLRLLVLRSAAFRAAFVRLLDGLSPHGPLMSRSHFSCYAEYGTQDEVLGGGRLDLAVELDEVLVGIEVKLSAEFQPEQPAKYEAELERVAQHLSEIRRKNVRYFVVVLAPEQRSAEVAPHLGANQRVLTWEALLDAFRSESGADPFTSILFEDFDRYLGDHLEFLPRFAEWAHHVRTVWESRGTEYQRKLLWRLRDLLPATGGRMGSGETWVGYYFSPGGEDEPRSWIGFVPATRAKGRADDRGALMVLATHREVTPEGTGCVPIDLDEPIWIDGVRAHDWEVRFDGDWSSLLLGSKG